MQKSIKSLTAFGFVCCSLVFGVIGHGEYNLPDEIPVISGDTVTVPSPYTIDLGEQLESDELNATADGKSIRYDANVKILNLFPVKSSTVTVTQRRYVVPSGEIFGIKLYTKGVVIAKIDAVTTGDGNVSPAKSAGLKSGDTISSINGVTVNRKSDVSRIIENCQGNALVFSLTRNGKALEVSMTPIKGTDGKYKAGLWVRDSSAGIGTMTFYDKYTGIFGGLGHAVCDVDTGEILPLAQGEAVEALVNGCYKGSHGKPGELCGVFGTKTIGSLLVNGETGIFGVLDKIPDGARAVPVALAHEITVGSAQIISDIGDGGAQYYDIAITRLYSNSETGLKNMVIRVVDEDLISRTGGIVQGMSGSPIIQNNMLIGAVTHVYVNDPLQGYAIFAENMLETTYDIQESLSSKAS